MLTRILVLITALAMGAIIYGVIGALLFNTLCCGEGWYP